MKKGTSPSLIKKRPLPQAGNVVLEEIKKTSLLRNHGPERLKDYMKSLSKKKKGGEEKENIGGYNGIKLMK